MKAYNFPTLVKLRQRDGKRHVKTWVSELTDAQRRELEAIRSDYRAGLIRCSVREIHEVLVAEMGIKVGQQQVRSYLVGPSTDATQKKR